MCAKIYIPANNPWIDIDKLQNPRLPDWDSYLKAISNGSSPSYPSYPYVDLLEDQAVAGGVAGKLAGTRFKQMISDSISIKAPPGQEVPDASTKEQIYAAYGVPNIAIGMPPIDPASITYTTTTAPYPPSGLEQVEKILEKYREEEEVKDVSINIPGREPVTRDLKVDLSGVTNLATQGAIKKIFDGLNGRGEAKPVLADPEKLARLLTIGLTRLQENLISKELDSDVVDLVMEEVATSFEYIILLARESGMIKVLLLREDPPTICKKKRTVIFGATNLEED